MSLQAITESRGSCEPVWMKDRRWSGRHWRRASGVHMTRAMQVVNACAGVSGEVIMLIEAVWKPFMFPFTC